MWSLTFRAVRVDTFGHNCTAMADNNYCRPNPNVIIVLATLLLQVVYNETT
jgi:hypothetical protein